MEEEMDSGRETLAAIKSLLVDQINLRELSRWKVTSHVRILRESLLWRTAELAETAFETLDSGKFVASALATRGVMETAAAIAYLHALVLRGVENGITTALIKKIQRFLINSQIWEELENPIHVNDMLRELEAVIPGYKDTYYAALCELAHPNWSGTFGAYGFFDKVNFVALFSAQGQFPENQKRRLLLSLAATLEVAKGYYEIVGGLVNDFVSATEAYFDANPPGQGNTD